MNNQTKTKMQKKTLYPGSFSRYQASPSPENTAALLRDINPVITGAVRSYGGGDPKATTRAKIMAIKALKAYDPKKGVQLNTYLMSQLRALNRVSRQRKNLIHTPENVYFNQRAIKQARDDYMAQYNREPTDTALADITGLSVKQISKADKYGSSSVPSSMGVSEKGDFMGDANQRDYYDIWVDYVYNDLDDKDRKIFEGVTGYNDKPIKPKQQIAKELKITPAAVSYRVTNITNKLEEMPQEDVG